MEIVKQPKNLEFRFKDVVFHVRAKATAEDRFQINMLYDVDKHGKVNVPRREIYRTLIERFVDGWEGVTKEGKPLPFSMENLGLLPAPTDNFDEDVIILLGSFIFKSCGLWPTSKDTEKKKD